mmetsp:Transcript_6140/g.18553  ORF Transcript_6140/g.18553 Transcript_6140/m.18553 type:complete len:86 (+) Transcript_6140:656-913(+)
MSPSCPSEYIGIDPENMVSLHESELVNAAKPYQEDPHGCRHDILTQKRASRNPFARTVPYPEGCPEIADLLLYCGSTPYSGAVPW